MTDEKEIKERIWKAEVASWNKAIKFARHAIYPYCVGLIDGTAKVLMSRGMTGPEAYEAAHEILDTIKDQLERLKEDFHAR